MNTEPTVRDYMTESPHTISVDRTLADAHSLMRQFHIRHLPVVEVDGREVMGVFTTVDALAALITVLARAHAPA